MGKFNNLLNDSSNDLPNNKFEFKYRTVNSHTVAIPQTTKASSKRIRETSFNTTGKSLKKSPLHDDTLSDQGEDDLEDLGPA